MVDAFITWGFMRITTQRPSREGRAVAGPTSYFCLLTYTCTINGPARSLRTYNHSSLSSKHFPHTVRNDTVRSHRHLLILDPRFIFQIRLSLANNEQRIPPLKDHLPTERKNFDSSKNNELLWRFFFVAHLRETSQAERRRPQTPACRPSS